MTGKGSGNLFGWGLGGWGVGGWGGGVCIALHCIGRDLQMQCKGSKKKKL